MPRPPRGDARTARRLHDEHHDFQRRFDELLGQARGGDLSDLDEAWRAFAADLHAHFAFEEEVFPAFAQQSTECRELVQQLISEHAAARQLLEDIGLQIQRQEIREPTIEVFADLMREHAAVEGARIYPWSELEPRAWSATSKRVGRRAR